WERDCSGRRKSTRRWRRSGGSGSGPMPLSGTRSRTRKASGRFATRVHPERPLSTAQRRRIRRRLASRTHMASSTRRVEAALERWAREVYGKAARKPGALRQRQFATPGGVGLDPPTGPREVTTQEKLGFQGEARSPAALSPPLNRARS